jgi:hypothetical protein
MGGDAHLEVHITGAQKKTIAKTKSWERGSRLYELQR